MNFSIKILSLIIISAILPNSALFTYDQAFSQHVLNSHLKTVKSVSIPSYTPSGSLLKNLFGGRQVTNKNLSDAQKIRQATDAFTLHSQSNQSMIDEQFIEKMGIVAGEGRKTDHHVMHAISSHNNRSLLFTSFGHARLLRLISEPINDLPVLKKRQEIIKALVKDEYLLKQAIDTLEKFKKAEAYFLDFFSEKYTRKSFDHLFWNLPLIKNNTYGQEAGARYSQFYQLFGIYGTLYILWEKVSNLSKSIFNKDNKYKRWEKSNILEKLISAGQYSWNSAYWILSVTDVHWDFQSRNNEIHYLQTKLIDIAECVKSSELLSKKLERLDKPDHFKNLSFQAMQKNYSKDFNQFIEALHTNTFKGTASQRSLIGRVLITNKMLEREEIYEQFKPFLQALSELESYVAITRKIKNCNQSSNPVNFCFVEFLEYNTPQIEGINTWNPCVLPEKAIGNDFIMSKATGQNYIMTGPNKGGKSTFMKSIMLNVLLAHTFGIAAGDTFAITPFDLLLSHLNESDSTVDDTSRFQAQCNTANKIFKAVNSLPNNKFCFVLLDEIFSGTSHDQENTLTLEFTRQLATLPQCCFMVATHLSVLTHLATENLSCINMHMDALTDAEGQVLNYTYKLNHGISKIKNADQVAYDAGLTWLKKKVVK